MSKDISTWNAREPVIKKTGDAIIYVGLCTAASLRHMLPAQCQISTIAPGLSFFGVGVFKYKEISDLRPGNEHYSWHDVYDILVQIPVRHLNSGRQFFIHRLYNSNENVAEWAKGDFLTKTPCHVEWNATDHSITTAVERKYGNKEKIVLSGKKVLNIPLGMWQNRLLGQIVDSYMLYEWQGQLYTFNAYMNFKRSFLANTTLTVEGIPLPKPLLGLSFILEDFDPLYIGPIMSSFHRCSYTP